MIGVEDIASTISELAPVFGISQAFLFGSFARGDQTEGSDVDLVVVLARPLGFKRAALHEALEHRLERNVDLIFGEQQLYKPVRNSYDREKLLVYAA